MKKKLEIVGHLALQLLVMAVVIWMVSIRASAQLNFCQDHIPCPVGDPCQVTIVHCAFKQCPEDTCIEYPCCSERAGVCVPGGTGCQYRTCCDYNHQEFCDSVSGYCISPP